MGRQIVNTNGQGRAQSTARIFTVLAIVAAAVILVVFFGLSKVTANQPSDGYVMQSNYNSQESVPQPDQTTGPSAMGAPPAQAK